MNDQIKRRIFIASGVGVLLGLPFGLNYFVNGKKKTPQSVFRKQLEHYHNELNVAIEPGAAPSAPELKINPSVESKTKYVQFLETFLPGSMSNVAAGLPDMFSVTEGEFATTATQEGSILLSGKDSLSKKYFPFDSSDRDLKNFMLMVRDNKLVQVTPKSAKQTEPRNRGFVHLFALPGATRKLALNQQFTADEGRIRPFKGIRTSYSIAGFDRLNQRETVRVHFEAQNYTAIGKGQSDQDFKTKEYHTGDAWFDLTTGLLVRQVVDFHSVVTGSLNDGRTNSKSVSDFRGLMTIQLYS